MTVVVAGADLRARTRSLTPPLHSHLSRLIPAATPSPINVRNTAVVSLIGRMVSHYEILELLGGGGMGVVYRAEDYLLKRTVALKFLPPDAGNDWEAHERFMHEAQAASALDHPNICTIHEIGRTDEGQLFICMAFYEGETVKQRIQDGPLTIPDALDIAGQVAGGLSCAHERGIVHRDIKPANVLVTNDGTAKIVDFGLAKLSGRTAITREGTPLGTVYYMSPEQSRGEPVDRRTDIWALGVLLYEMIVGHRPFEGEYENVILYSIMNMAPKPVTSQRTGVPMELEKIIDKCLEKNPADRYQHLDEFLVDIRHVARESESLTRLPGDVVHAGSSRPARKLPIPRLLPVLAAAVILAGAYWFLRTPEPKGRAGARRKSIAVLPFASITRSSEDEIFADGMHDDILTQLSRIRDMRVIGRTSMLQYKDTKKRLREIGNELDAGYILEGTVRRNSRTVRITAQLIETETEGDVWADDYDRDVADVFAIQSEIAAKIASSLQSVLSPMEKWSIGTQETGNEKAHQFYLRGRYYWYNTTTPEGNKLAAEFYQKATELDPGFATAYACLSMVNGSLYYSHQDPSPQRLRKSEEALARASVLGPDLPEVHHARGLYFAEMKNDPESALKEYRLALEKRPGDADVMFDYAYALVRERNLDQALEWLTWGLDRDPMALFTGMHPLVINFAERNWDEALRWCDRYIAARPSDPMGYYQKAFILIDGFGALDRARTVLDDEAKYGSDDIGGSRRWVWPLWRIECLSRRFDRAMAVLDADSSLSLEKGITLFYLGRKDEAKKSFLEARSKAEKELKTGPPGAGAYEDLGRALAWLGQEKESLGALTRALDLTPPESDQWLTRERREESLAEAYTLAGEYDRAADRVIELLLTPSFLTPWKIRLDPLYDPLREHPKLGPMLSTGR